MAEAFDQPTLNIGAVCRETGLSEHTVRAWERRYGVPHPQRTAGGHRLYSARDVALLKWLRDQQDAGVSISRAVALWRQQPPASPAWSVREPAAAATSATELDRTRAGWLQACLAFDERAAEALLAEALAVHPVETVCAEVLQRGLSEIGDGWYQGSVSVQQEHFASALAIRRLEALIAATPSPVREARIVIACAEGDEHTVVPLVLTLMLRRRGWDVVFLGANVPVDGLDATLARTSPAMFVLSAMQLPSAVALIEAAEIARRRGVRVGYGGQIFSVSPGLRQRVPGAFLGASVPEAVRTIEDLIVRAPQSPSAGLDQTTMHDLVQHGERRRRLEIDLTRALTSVMGATATLAMVAAFIADRVAAGWTLGDISVIEPDVAWLAGYLRQQGLLPETIHAVFLVCRHVIATVAGELGQPFALASFETGMGE